MFHAADYSGLRAAVVCRPAGAGCKLRTGACPDPSRAHLITNPNSGANVKTGVAGVRDVAARAGLGHTCLEDLDGLGELLRRLSREEVRLLIVNGGDGTVCRILETIRNEGLSEPALALLRGGTTNLIHHDVGFRGKPETALHGLLESLGSGRLAFDDRRVLQVWQSSRDLPRLGFFLGTHAAVRAILRTRERFHARRLTGRVSETMSVGAMVWRLLRRRIADDPLLSPVPLELSRNGGEWATVSHVLLLAMSVRRLILGIRPVTRGQAAGVAELSWPDYRALPWFWRFVRGNLEELGTISLRGELRWILDGEVYEHRRSDGALTIDAGAPARFLVPGR